MVMITTRMAPVASVLQSSASASFPPDSFAAMMPEPMTAATSNAVPRASAVKRRARLKSSMVPPDAGRRSQQQPPLLAFGASPEAKGIDVPQPGKIP